ncbi:hypothetical protein [Enterobacter sichuanensis]
MEVNVYASWMLQGVKPGIFILLLGFGNNYFLVIFGYCFDGGGSYCKHGSGASSFLVFLTYRHLLSRYL